MMVLVIGLVIMVICIVFFQSLINAPIEEEKKKASKEYHDSLKLLRDAPNDHIIKERTLTLGRSYSVWLGKSKDGHALFDEVALMNDINAACARSTVGQEGIAKVEVTNLTAFSGRSAAQEIEQLGKLFLGGVITAEEFERGKTLFLGAPPDKAASAVELLQNLDNLRKKGVISESEFNTKKWEVLSERLIPGKMQAARLQQPATRP